MFNINSFGLFMPTLGPLEIILILSVVVLLFGAKKIPELFKGVGGGIKEFKKALNTTDEEKAEEKKISNKSID